MFRSRLLIAPCLIGALLAWSGPAAADLWPPPWAKPRHHRKLVTPSGPAQDFRVKGFRSAVFGMDQGQVLGAIAKDFHLGSIRNGALVQDGPVRVRWHAPEMIP